MERKRHGEGKYKYPNDDPEGYNTDYFFLIVVFVRVLKTSGQTTDFVSGG